MRNHIRAKVQGTLFDKMSRLDELLEMGDPLARLDTVVDWAVFTPILARLPRSEQKGPGGRPSFEPGLMFKVLVIQNLYGLSDHQTEFQITDRMSFKRFLGLSDADKAPDEKTVWAFREALNRAGIFDCLFAAFGRSLESMGMIARKGQMIDASFVEVPRQHNTREENEIIKNDGIPKGWKASPAKARQKDVDARWTRKHDERYFGYKNHVKVDSASKLITSYAVTDASVHDSQVLETLVKPGDPTTYADSAYAGEPSRAIMKERGVEFKPIDRPWRNRPLNGTQKRINKARSRTRVRVEHVFATMVMSMRAAYNRCIGRVRNAAAIAFTNLVYNMVRLEQIKRGGLKCWRTA
jgi:transposase, IS5 family